MLVKARDIIADFHRMIRRKAEHELAPWMDRARESLVASFGNGVAKDIKAVRAAIVSPWSNGQTERQIAKLKLVKRQMYELAERSHRRIERHLAEAHQPPGETLDSFAFDAVPMVSKAQVMAIAAGDTWLAKGAIILMFGPPGGGKSHLAAAVGLALIENGWRVLFTRKTDLLQKLQVARRELQLEAAIAKLDKFDLLILDDLAYVNQGQGRVASPELLPENGLLPHLNCSRRINLGSFDEEGKHGDTCGIGGGDQLSLCVRRASREGEDVGRVRGAHGLSSQA